jgi:diguanylate cyclase (GGDEF)-like protein
MASVLGISAPRSKPSAFAVSRTQPVLQAAPVPVYQLRLSRREWWLWFSALVVTTLALVAFSLTFFNSFFGRMEHFYEIRSDQARWATFALLLIFNSWLVYRQWSFRRLRERVLPQSSAVSEVSQQVSDSALFDPVTGLHTRASLEQHLAKEIARARRQNTTLSLATLHVDDLADISARFGKSAVDSALKELARCLRKASRGSDTAARLSDDDFVLLLPECSATEVKQVLNRVVSVEVSASGKRIPLTYTTGWVDYQAGEMPADLLKRAASLLHLYDSAAKSSLVPTLR